MRGGGLIVDKFDQALAAVEQVEGYELQRLGIGVIIEMKDAGRGRFIEGLAGMDDLLFLSIYLQQGGAFEDIAGNGTRMRMEGGFLAGREADLVYLDAGKGTGVEVGGEEVLTDNRIGHDSHFLNENAKIELICGIHEIGRASCRERVLMPV